ncbi:MAG: diacylglycerol kinase [Porphyromonadaceae bacterium CG2_30_38_12]|nr:MAG: diacylglycerol kinase [Porphyromonadaceae bacterium CG2_30_38_12]
MKNETNNFRGALIKRLRSFGYAFAGIRSVFGKEANMNIHLIIALLVVVCGFIFDINLSEWMLCILCFGLVISLEMVNSAIENLVNIVSPQHNALAGKIKDIAAGAVLVAAISAATVGLIIFVPKGLAMLLSFL